MTQSVQIVVFDGALLRGGFWLCVWDTIGESSSHSVTLQPYEPAFLGFNGTSNVLRRVTFKLRHRPGALQDPSRCLRVDPARSVRN
jgi:hypothetical protein